MCKADEDRGSIVIVGFMGAGKTTIGRQLAGRLCMPFVDTDLEIEKAFLLPIPEIFLRHGEEAFREAERAMILELLEQSAQVISLGGGAYADPNSRAALNTKATTIWLDPPFERIAERLARSAIRPLAADKTSKELWQLWNERRPHYAHAHIRIETGEDSSEAVEAIMSALR